jgi:hypothetical protein
MAASHSQDQLSRSLAVGKLRLARSSSSFTSVTSPRSYLTRTPAVRRGRGSAAASGSGCAMIEPGSTSLGIAEEGGANGENPALRNPEVSQTCLLAEWAWRAEVLVTQAG